MIILIRHGKAENAAGRAIGQTDLPLSEEGEQQAQNLARAMQGCKIEQIITSPLLRTMHTAKVIARSCPAPITPLPEIIEIDLGRWDGLSYEQIKAEFPEEYMKRGNDFAGYRPPSGENFLDLRERVSAALKQLSAIREPCIVVTHAGVIRIMLQLIIDFPLKNLFRIKPRHCHATIISNDDKGLTIQAYNIPPCSGLKDLLRNG